MAIRSLYSAKSDVGRKRGHNEDRFLADPALGLYVVCDGMGGGNAGEVASAMAIETIHSYLLHGAPPNALPLSMRDANLAPNSHRLADAVRAANKAVHRAAWTQPAYAGMGTTVVAATLTNELLSIVHVGDSRLYLIRQDKIQPLTSDHSWVTEQVQRGLLTEEEAERSPKRNIVTRALGIDGTVDVEQSELTVRHGDCLLLCTDGLTRGVHPTDILHAVDDPSEMDAAADRLVAMANEAGGEDNTTVLLVRIVSERFNPLWQRVLQNWLPKAS